MKHSSAFLSFVLCKISEDLFFWGSEVFFEGGGAVKASFGWAKYMTKFSMNLSGFLSI